MPTALVMYSSFWPTQTCHLELKRPKNMFQEIIFEKCDLATVWRESRNSGINRFDQVSFLFSLWHLQKPSLSIFVFRNSPLTRVDTPISEINPIMRR
jgi:hypothetical protein